jgi:hypothetical protein
MYDYRISSLNPGDANMSAMTLSTEQFPDRFPNPMQDTTADHVHL